MNQPKACISCGLTFWTAHRYQSRCHGCQAIADKAMAAHRAQRIKRGEIPSAKPRQTKQLRKLIRAQNQDFGDV
jgi:hypothetical protein